MERKLNCTPYMKLTKGFKFKKDIFWKRCSIVVRASDSVFEPHHEKTTICICKNREAGQLLVYCEADHAFVFATGMVHFFFLNPKFQVSSLLL